MKKLIITLIILFTTSSLLLAESRIKDLTSIAGASGKKIIGYGLVIGLEGTGDGTKSMMTVQSVANMLEHFGVSVDKRDLKPKNVAAVMVTADFPSYGRNGMKVDVTVSSLSDAKSLQGGQLLLTPLQDPLEGKNGAVYAMASGSVSIGGFNISDDSNSFTKNYTLVGRIPSGATLKRDGAESIIQNGAISLYLVSPDYTTSVRMAKSINNFFGQEIAFSKSNAEVKVSLPAYYQKEENVMEFVAILEGIGVSPDDIAKVVVNERTGTIVIGENVKLNPVAISHGSLSITIEAQNEIIQPEPLSQGQTAKQRNSKLYVSEDKAKVIQLKETATLKQLVDALNLLGVTPRDMISIFQSLKEAGALHAELVLI